MFQIFRTVLGISVLAVSCAVVVPDQPEPDSDSWARASLLLDRERIDVSVPISHSRSRLAEPVHIKRSMLAATPSGRERGAWFPIVANFDRRRENSQTRHDFSIRIGVDMVEGVDLSSRMPEEGVAELETSYWEFDSSESARRAEELHRANVHLFEVFRLPGRAWERHFSEGILGSVYDLYRTPVTRDIYLNMVFVYDRQRWKADEEWYKDRLRIAHRVLETVRIGPREHAVNSGQNP